MAELKQPITKGVSKVPVIMQMEALECGAASLAMVLAYYGKWVPLEQVRSDCGVSRDGANAKNILKAARHYQLDCKAFRLEPDTLKENGMFPCIIHWNFNHFVVLNGFKGNKAVLNDPARGTVTVSMETFDQSFTGITLFFEPNESFVPSGKPKSVLSFAKERLRGTGAAVAFTALTGICAALVTVINPTFSRVFIDRLLTQRDPAWLIPFLVLLAGFNLIQIVLSGMEAVYKLRITGKMAVLGEVSYLWKVLHLPLEFFSQRMAGDIQERQLSNASIANTLIDTFAPLLINTAMMLFYLVVMLRYSVLLTVIGLLSLAINAVIPYFISKINVNISRVSTRDAAKLSSTTVAGFSMIETIKAAGAENGYFSKWAGYQANVSAQQSKSLRVQTYLGIIPAFASALANNAVLILGVWLTMNGQFTVGMITAFQGFLTSFMLPAQSIITSGRTLQEMRIQMERINDVMQYPEETVFAPESDSIDGKLSGRLELNHITFGYARLGAPVVQDFSMTIEPGQSVAIVGGSGCGKSTMSKLISGLYKPWSGEILFDGRPLSEIPRNQFCGSLAVVDQDIILFEDTIANNIKMFDHSIEDFEMILAARDAQIHDDISQRPGGYQYRLIEGGKDFSGGQRQRIEIARVLAQDPTVVILDEATSALDAKTEYDVVRSIRDRGITTIVIAHRLSTIRSCDQIIVMDKGIIIARGTHSELMETCELYRDLVTSE